ncbi:MAG: lipocalin family protein [Gammaproteobacteria bacterium]
MYLGPTSWENEGYEYALVAGPNRPPLRILARQPDLDASVTRRLVAKASGLGFDTGALIVVDTRRPRPRAPSSGPTQG